MPSYAKFYFRPARGEQIFTSVTPEQDDRAFICGRVLDSRERPLENAVLMLYRTEEAAVPQLLSQACTDEDGQFVFGPLEGEKLYLIKVFKEGLKLRELELKAE